MAADLDLSSVLYLPLCYESLPQDVRSLVPASLSLDRPTQAADERDPDAINPEVLGFIMGVSASPASAVAYAARISARDLFVIEKATFATSRPCRTDHAGLASFYPQAHIATLLVMQDVSGDAAHHSVLSVSAVCDDFPSLRHADKARHDASGSISDSSDFRTARSRVTSRSSVPLQTRWEVCENTDPTSHYSLFADYRDFRPSIPVICVAEDDVIISLLRSAVYQRLVWGVSAPIVGVAFSPGSTAVQVLLAWSSETIQKGSVPLVNIANTQSPQSDFPAGWFDLSSPSQTAAFVQYISAMVQHETHPCPLTPNSQVEHFEWRLDCVSQHARLVSAQGDKSASVCAWAKDALSHSSEPVAPSLHLLSDEDTESLPDSLEDGAFLRRYTHVDIATGASDINQPFTTVTRWLWDRLALTQSVLPLIESGTIPEAYISLTRFAWHDDWDSSAPLPDSVAEFSDLRGKLLDMKQAYRKSAPKDNVEYLDSTAAAELSANFKYVLSACEQAEVHRENSRRHASPVACGYIWEAMISRFMQGETSKFRSATAIALPRSAFVDRSQNEEWLRCALHVAYQYRIYVSQHYKATRKFLEDAYERMSGQEETQEGPMDIKKSVLVDQALAAGVTLGPMPARVCEDPCEVLDLASTYPIYGFCDAVAAVCVPDFVTNEASQTLRRAAERYALLQKGSARRTVAYYHGVCDVAASRPQFAAAQDLFRANARSAGIPPETKDTIDLNVLSTSPPCTDRSQGLPEVRLKLQHVPRPPSLPPSAVMNSEDEAGFAAKDNSTSSNPAYALELPLLFVNHSPPEKAISHVGSNQHRMCAASGAAFLGAAGLSNIPVFSLVTDGTRGVLTCAWAEVYDGFQRIRIAERNGVLFDLANPLSAFHFATFLVRLKHEQGRLLREHFDELALARLRERLEEGEWETRWTMSHYINEQEAP